MILNLDVLKFILVILEEKRTFPELRLENL